MSAVDLGLDKLNRDLDLELRRISGAEGITHMPDPKAKLLHEWDHGKDRYRLIARGKWKPGYEDEYLVERLGKDGYGEPRWDYFAQWSASDTCADDVVKCMLVNVIKSLLQEPDGEKKVRPWGL